MPSGGVRGYRYAQPPANGLNPVGVPDAVGFSFAKAPTVGIVNPILSCECVGLRKDATQSTLLQGPIISYIYVTGPSYREERIG